MRCRNNLSNYYDPWYLDGNGDVMDTEFINPNNGTTWSVVASVGTRYKLTVLSDLMIDLRWQYYFTDFVDGLDHKLPSNKADDWLVWLNFGYIYYLD